MRWDSSCRIVIIVTVALAWAVDVDGQLPAEPLLIDRDVPQFVHDSQVVDNHWAIRYKRQSVKRVFHAPKKHAENPFSEFAGDSPSYVWVVRDTDRNGESLFRMYYQANARVAGDRDTVDRELLPEVKKTGRKYRTDVCYAESRDGIRWTKPDLNLFPGKTWAKPNNVVIGFKDRPSLEACAPVALEGFPEADRRGYKFLLMYRAKGRGGSDVNGIRLVGTRDGVNFDVAGDTRIAKLSSDHHNSICYDPVAKDYVMFCRAKQMYRAFGEEMIDTGASRRIAVMRSPDLWGDWLLHDQPRTVLIPDERDDETYHSFFYGMPTVYRHGIFWGFLEPFRMNDFIHTELATSRDGNHWQRLPSRPQLIPLGDPGSWDDTMIFASPSWVEQGNEWWFYYSGWDGPHGTTERSGCVGLATCKRERLISLRGPVGGGVVCTRTLVWPGGDLWINAATLSGRSLESDVTVRISDTKRKPFAGFDHTGCRIDVGDDDTRATVIWENEKSLNELAGQTIRIEVFLRNADWFSFGSAREKQDG